MKKTKPFIYNTVSVNGPDNMYHLLTPGTITKKRKISIAVLTELKKIADTVNYKHADNVKIKTNDLLHTAIKYYLEYWHEKNPIKNPIKKNQNV